MRSIAFLFSRRNIVVFLMQCNILFAICMPDEYLGLADYFYFPTLISIIALLPFIWNPMHCSKSVSYILFVMLWQIVVLLVSIITLSNIDSGYFFSYLLYLVLFLSCFTFEFSNIELRRILNSYLLSGVLVSCIIMYQHRGYYDGEVRFTILLFAKEMFDPNFLGAFLVIPFLIAFYKIINCFSLYKLICFLIICIGLLMTASRGAMLSSLLGALIGLIDVRKKIGSKKGIIGIIFVFVIIICFVLYFLPEGSYERLFMDSYDDNSNDKRVENWIAGLKAFEYSPLFGYGYNGEMFIVKSIVGENRIAHNTYISFLLNFGLIGCFIMLHGIVILFTNAIKRRLFSLVGMLTATLVVNFFISGEVAFFFWIPLLVISCILINIKSNAQLTISDYI